MARDTIHTPRIPRRTDPWCPPLQKTQGWGSLNLWSSMGPKRKGGPVPNRGSEDKEPIRLSNQAPYSKDALYVRTTRKELPLESYFGLRCG
jgi:hypothetical protein